MLLIKEALLNKVRLYNKNNGNWYAPEEFKAKYENRELNNYEIESILENMVIRDLRAGNLAYHKKIDKRVEKFYLDIQELKNKGEVFLNKVIQYYQRK